MKNKTFWKIIGFESIYMFFVSLAAALTCALQLFDRQFIKTEEGTVVSITYYKYNSLMFIVGMIVFWGLVFFLYKKVLEKSMKHINEIGIVLRIFAWIVVLLWGVIMFAFLVISGYLTLGLSTKMEPQGFLEIVLFGRPVIMVVLLGIDIIRRGFAKTDDK